MSSHVVSPSPCLPVSPSAAKRATRLRRIAAVEIARHREKHGVLGAALDGSLATGAIWPTSDLDFTIVPAPSAEERHGVEWGQREGIIWHKHLTPRQALLDLMEGYPASFIGRADREFSLDANWLLDGLALMEVVEDPEGLLAETKAFVAARRFAAEVWQGRREALLKELRRQRDAARQAMDLGEPEKAYQILSRPTGLANVAAQLWLEAARRIYSHKEQDGLLAEVTRSAGCPEAHALYRATMAVDAERAEAAGPLVLELGSFGTEFYRLLEKVPAKYRGPIRRMSVWAAWIRHLSAKMALAPRLGHPAYVYQQLGTLCYWCVDSPRRDIQELREKGAPGVEALEEHASGAVRLAEEARTTLLGAAPAGTRAATALAASGQLVKLTERGVS